MQHECKMKGLFFPQQKYAASYTENECAIWSGGSINKSINMVLFWNSVRQDLGQATGTNRQK